MFQGKHHGSAVAVKVLEIGEDRMMLQACEEFGHLHSLRHSKLVISYGACVDVRPFPFSLIPTWRTGCLPPG